MFSIEALTKYKHYSRQLRLIIWSQRVVILGLLILGGIAAAHEEAQIYSDADLSTTFFVSAALVLLAGRSFRYFWGERIKHLLWSDFSRNLPLGYQIPGSPVLNATPVTQDNYATVTIAGQTAILSQAHIEYDIRRTPNPDASSFTKFSLDYLVLAVPLEKSVPHLFIDGKRQNRFSSKNPNLWSLPKRIRHGQRVQNLEGDFYKSFTVYATDEKQIETLSILTPDTMLALRDKGYEFDYELYGGYLYVISEPNLITPESYEAFIAAAEGALREFVPQVTKQQFSSEQASLQTGAVRMYLWATFFSAVIVTKWVILVFTSLLFAFGLGNLIYSLST